MTTLSFQFLRPEPWESFLFFCCFSVCLLLYPPTSILSTSFQTISREYNYFSAFIRLCLDPSLSYAPFDIVSDLLSAAPGSTQSSPLLFQCSSWMPQFIYLLPKTPRGFSSLSRTKRESLTEASKDLIFRASSPPY